MTDKNKRIAHDIKVMVVSETQKQRLAFSDTVVSCGFTLVDCLDKKQLKYYYKKTPIDVWLIDSQYDNELIDFIEDSQSNTVLVGFSEAPYINETQLYQKWQRKLKRKLANMLNMPELIHQKKYHKPEEIKPWRYVVLLGASMGGPNAVKTFLDNLSPDLPICLLLAHHFDANNIQTLPRVLNRNNQWQCKVITTTQTLRTGHCLIAPIVQKIVCDSTGRIILQNEPWQGSYKPNIGEILKNTSDVYGNELIAIIFSGMGNDGSQYLDKIQMNHSQIWAQDPNDSACTSQPQSIINSGYCNYIGTSAELAQHLTDYVKRFGLANHHKHRK